MLVSAVIADGPPRRVLEAIRDRAWDLILPAPTIDELERVLSEKLRIDDGSIGSIVALLRELALQVTEAPADVTERSGNPADDRIIAAALARGAEVLVSGDRKHILALQRIGPMRIVRPQEILAELAS